jgi:hypothetical protein
MVASAIIAAIAAIVAGTATAISGGVSASNTRKAGEEAKRIADLNFQEQQKQERMTLLQNRDINTENARMNEIKLAIERKDRETQRIAAQANAAIAMLNNKSNLQSRLSTLSFGGR